MNYLAQSLARVGQVVTGSLVAGSIAFGGLALTGLQLGSPSPTLAAAVPPPAWEAARVTRVVDGDTYEVLTGGQVLRVRLLGVDAPEHDQAFGLQATDSAMVLLRGRLVRLQRHGTDLYGRTLSRLRLAGSTTSAGGGAVDSLLVVRGWAWAFDPGRVLAERQPEQVTAQRAGRGLWKCGVAAALPPKVWRGFTATIKRRYGVGCTW